MAKSWTFLLALVILFGLTPMSVHTSFMPLMPMDDMLTSNHGTMDGQNASRSSSAGCCDAMTYSVVGCAIAVSHVDTVAAERRSDRIGYSIPIVRQIALKTAVPPPKS